MQAGKTEKVEPFTIFYAFQLLDLTMKRFPAFLLLFPALFIILSCQKNDTPVKDGILPIVFVHGYSGSGDSYTKMIEYFRANGYPANKLYTYDWNTLDLQSAPKNTKPLRDFILDVLKKTGYDKVNLIGHSLGGSLTFNYCSNTEYAVSVKRLAWLAPYLKDRTKIPDSAIPTLNLRSNADYVVTDTSTIPFAVNRVIPDKDHNEIASCKESFAEIFTFFNDGKEPVTTIQEDDRILISGKVVSFLENAVGSGNTIEIYEVSANDGTRLSTTPVSMLHTDAKGYYSEFAAKKDTYYEFEVSTGRAADRPIHFYFEPFKNSSHVIYLRTFPPQSSFLNLGFNAIIPFSETQGVSIFFSVSKALLLGRDALTINGYDCVTTAFSQKEMNTLAYFMYDENNNNASDYTSVALFSSATTFKGIDFSLPATEFSTYTYNGRVLHTPNWPSSSNGLSVALFY
jgi:esterase/lipase